MKGGKKKRNKTTLPQPREKFHERQERKKTLIVLQEKGGPLRNIWTVFLS